jgi:hypothetical protein
MTDGPTAWDARSAVSRSAHVLERVGLAMAGGSCGLFVAAHMVRANIDMGSGISVFAMMLFGALGFYLGIDLPPARVSEQPVLGPCSKTDAVELLSAGGTFLSALAAVISVYVIVVDEHFRAGTVFALAVGWAIGASMQVAAGIIARARRAGTAG